MIDSLNLEMTIYGNYGVVATYFQKYDSAMGKYVKIDIPEDEEAFKKAEKVDDPIYEVMKDDNDPEICLIKRYLPEKNEMPTPMIFSGFYDHIRKFPRKYRNYEVVTSAWMHLDDEYTGRLDSPVVAVLVDDEKNRICMVEAPPE